MWPNHYEGTNAPQYNLRETNKKQSNKSQQQNINPKINYQLPKNWKYNSIIIRSKGSVANYFYNFYNYILYKYIIIYYILYIYIYYIYILFILK